MIRFLVFIVLGLNFCLSSLAWADDKDITQSSIDISKELRCPMATNQTLFESETAIASELKAQIYLKLKEGKSREEIIKFMVDRYGEQIHYQPSLTFGTALLWSGPVLFLAILLGILFYIRREQKRYS